jgi:hypothetical protein
MVEPLIFLGAGTGFVKSRVLSKVGWWTLRRFYRRLGDKFWRIADVLSMVMSGLCGSISALIIHNFFSHDFG